ncbi:MAG: YkgJ family cysteine cluster protein, partial [Deltaproteobacteria bacterium]
MRTPSTTVPPLREDVTAKKFGGRLVVEDPVRRVRVPVDALTIAVMQELADGPSVPSALVEAIGAPRVELWRRVSLLNAHQLLETPRALAQCQLHRDAAAAPPPVDAATAPLTWPAGLRHGCVASGGCCHGTDVGPLKADDIAKIKAIDWSPYLPDDVHPDDWLVETTAPNGEVVTLLGMRHGRCVFLDSDKLCVVHKVAGSAQKPTICRQFPYTFTRTPRGVDVSYAMECRAWHRARLGGPEPGADEATARTYLAEGGPLLELPAPVPLWAGVDLATEGWLAL